MKTSSREKGAGASILASESQPRRSWLQRIRDWLWGYDFFVSYHWASGGPYAVNLAQRLRDAKYDVFLDRAEYAMGDDWKKVGGRALANTQRLILVATREAVTDSKPVAREVRLFTGRNRQLIPIAFADDLQGLDWNASDVLRRLEGSRLRITEDVGSLSKGPSDQTIDQLVRTHGLMRRRTLRRWIISVMITLISVSALVAGFQRQVAVAEARKANLQLANYYMRQGIFERDEEGDLLKASHYLFQAAVAGKKAREPRLSLNGRIAGNSTAQLIPTRWRAFEYSGRVHRAHYGEDAQWLLTLEDDKAWIWDIGTGKTLSGPMFHEGIKGAQFSKDKTRLLTWGGEQARVWESHTGEPSFEEPMVLDRGMTRVELSEDGRRVLTWGGITAQVWSGDTDKVLLGPITLEKRIKGAVLSRDNRRVLLWTSGTARVWDTQTGAMSDVMSHRLDGIKEASFSSDQKSVLTWGGWRAQVWDGYTGKPTSPLLQHRYMLHGASLSEDGKLVLTWIGKPWSEHTDVALVWDSESGELLSEPMKHPRIKGARFSQDQKWVLTWGGASARVWESRTGKPVSGPLTQGWTEIRGALFSPDQERVFTWGGPPIGPGVAANLWDSRASNLLAGPMVTGNAIFGADGKRLLTWGSSVARIRDSHTGKPLFGPMAHEGISGAIFSTDQDLVVTWGAGVVQIWDSRTPGILPNPTTLTQAGGKRLSPDGKWLLIWDQYKARVWDWRTQQPLSAPMAHKGFIRGAAFSPEGKLVLTWGDEIVRWSRRGGTARVWDSRTGEPLIEPIVHEGIRGAVFSQDQRWVLTWGKDGAANIWDSRTGSLLSGPKDHGEGIKGASFSADGQKLLTWGGDIARIWDSRSDTPRHEPMMHEGIIGARFSAEGLRILTWGGHSVQIWDRETARPVTESLKHVGLRDVRFSSDQRLVLTWGSGRARIWSIRPDENRELLMELDGDGFGQGERWLLNWQGSDGIKGASFATGVWDSGAGKWYFEPIGPGIRDVRALLCMDKRRVLTWSNDVTARVLDSLSGDPVSAPMAHYGAPDVVMYDRTGSFGARFSRDQHRVMTWDNKLGEVSVRLWDSHTGEPLSPDPNVQGSSLLDNTMAVGDGNLVLTWRSGYRSLLGDDKVSDLMADLDFPDEHLILRLEVMTGRRVTDVGDVEHLAPGEWKARWVQYEPLAREHLRNCRHPTANWYLDRMLHRPGSCEGPGDWLGHVNPERLQEVKEMYAAVCLDRGRELLAKNRYQEARRRFDTARIVRPAHAAAYEGLARSLIESGDDPSKGVDYARRSLELNPYQAPEHALAALLEGHQATGQEVEAARIALRLAGAYFQWQEYRPAVEAYRYALPFLLEGDTVRGQEGELAKTALKVAGAYVRLREYEQALETYFLALDLQPELKEQLDVEAFGTALDELLVKLKNAGDPRELAAAFDRAMRAGLADAERSAVWANSLAYCFIERDVDIAKGIAYANRSRKLDPTQPLRYAPDTLARGYIKQGRYDEAIALLQEMLEKATHWEDKNTLDRTLKRARAEKEVGNTRPPRENPDSRKR